MASQIWVLWTHRLFNLSLSSLIWIWALTPEIFKCLIQTGELERTSLLTGVPGDLCLWVTNSKEPLFISVLPNSRMNFWRLWLTVSLINFKSTQFCLSFMLSGKYGDGITNMKKREIAKNYLKTKILSKFFLFNALGACQSLLKFSVSFHKIDEVEKHNLLNLLQL